LGETIIEVELVFIYNLVVYTSDLDFHVIIGEKLVF
jgi:hypothetical protein